MLADEGAPPPQRQGLIQGLHRAGEQFLKLIDFIASHLPKWRDDPRRKANVAENRLSEHLCDYLNHVARNDMGIESFKFGREPQDEANPRGNLDVSAKPDGEWLTVGEKHYSIYDTFLPIECKRLPMPEPKRKKRDHREYLYDEHKSAGGVQRFKTGKHGAHHSIAAMIGYVQSGNADEWLTQINGWVTELADNGTNGWSNADALSLDGLDQAARFASLSSRHKRVGDLNDIDLKHLWIEM